MLYPREWHSFCLLNSVGVRIDNLSRVMNQQRHPMPMKAHDGGFSLIEILVVIGVIGILVGIAIPAYYDYHEKAKTARVMEELKRIERAIIALATDTGEWPEHQAIGEINDSGNEIYDLNDKESGLVLPDTSPAFPNWNGPYIQSIPLDPWGHNYFLDTDYRIGGVDHVVLGSFGPVSDATAIANKNKYKDTDIRLVIPLK